MKDPWNRSGLTYSELCQKSMWVGDYRNLPKEPEFGQLCHYIGYSGCTHEFVEWLGVLGWVWVADL